MASSPRHFIAALATLLAATSGYRASAEIRAATSYGRNLILFNGEGQAVSAASNQVESFFPVPNNFQMTAATCQMGPMMFPVCIFYGNGLIYDEYQAISYENRKSFYYANLFPEFVWHDLDAVVATLSDEYFFKGCKYIRRDASGNFDLTPRNVADLKVPCDVDAGWFDGTNGVVLKGNQVWKLGNDINAPRDFKTYVDETYG